MSCAGLAMYLGVILLAPRALSNVQVLAPLSTPACEAMRSRGRALAAPGRDRDRPLGRAARLGIPVSVMRG